MRSDQTELLGMYTISLNLEKKKESNTQEGQFENIIFCVIPESAVLCQE